MSLSDMNLSDLGEFGLIEQLRQGAAVRTGVRLGIGDDAAVLEALATPIVTSDALVEGIHFRRDWMTAAQLGIKAMAANVSDLAAMGARPRAAFICLGLPPSTNPSWVTELYQGFECSAERWGFTVAGGDTVRSPAGIMLAITLVGEPLLAGRGPVLRSGARPGDLLFVTGTLGDAAAGLHLLQHPATQVLPAERAYVLDRHLEPQPRLQEMQLMLGREGAAVRAAMDLSDGIGGDARHLAQRSGVHLNIGWEALPVSRECEAVAAACLQDARQWAASGGEDFELLVAVDPQLAPDWAASFRKQNKTRLTQVGVCLKGAAGLSFYEGGIKRPGSGAFTHF